MPGGYYLPGKLRYHMILAEMIRRPTPKELGKKIAAARAMILGWAWEPANPGKLMTQFGRLGLFSREEQGLALAAAAGELSAGNYAGHRPPQECTEEPFAEEEMFAFAWQSPHFGCRMYFKFVVGKTKCGVVSLHREEKR